MSAERPEWTPASEDSAAHRCQNCDGVVTARFARVFGHNADVAHACPSCTDYRRMTREASNAGGGLR